MANTFARFSRAFGAILLLVGLSACVGPPRHYSGGGYGGRGYASYQPAYRGGYGHGGYQHNWR